VSYAGSDAYSAVVPDVFALRIEQWLIENEQVSW
jgi:hypothetical protein